MFGWYSSTQFNNLNDDDRNKSCKKEYPYIYYMDINNKVVQVTEVMSDKEKKSNFNDAVYLGELSRFLCVSVEPKTQFN